MHSLIYFNYSSLYLQQIQNLKYFKHKNIFHKILTIYHKYCINGSFLYLYINEHCIL